MKQFRELVKKILIKKHGIKSCKKIAQIPLSEEYCICLRENVERDYSKYKCNLSEKNYENFIEDIFEIHKDYKKKLLNSRENEYGKIYGDCAEQIVDAIHKYGLKTK